MKEFVKGKKIILINILLFLMTSSIVVLQQKVFVGSEICTNIIFAYLYFLILELVYWCINEYIKEISHYELLIGILGTFIIWGILSCFLVKYLHVEHDIYTWDSCVYWIKVINQDQNAYSNILRMLSSVRGTLGTQEYNDLAAIPLIPFIHYFGKTFVKYSFFILCLYYMPACILLSLFVTRISEKNKFSLKKYLFTFAIIMFIPGLFLPVLDGYLDVIGVIFIGLMIHTIYDWDYLKINPKVIAKLSILSLLLLLARRWYAFFIVGFYVAIGVEFLINECKEHKWNALHWRNIIINYFAIVIVCIIVLLFMAPEIFHLFFGNGYSDAYSSYKTRTFYQDLLVIMKDWGFLATVISFVGVFIGTVKEFKARTLRKPMFQLLVATIVTFSLFQYVQSMGEHHRYLMMPLFITGFTYGLLSFLNFFNQYKLKMFGGCAVIVYCGLTFLNSFTNVTNIKTNLLSQIKETPYFRDDMEEINSLVDYLIQETDGTSKKIYIAVDSNEFSQELLNRSKMPDRVVAVPGIVGASIKDTRDGFPSQAFLADYILVAPTLENNQKVISELTNLLTKNEMSKDFYSLEKQETITGNIPIYIYKKISPLTPEFIDEMANEVKKEYPDNEFINCPNYFISLANIYNAGSLEYYSYIAGYQVQKKENEDLCIDYVLDGEFKTIEFTVDNWYSDTHLLVYAENELISDKIMDVDGTHTYSYDVSDVINLKVIIKSGYEQIYTFGDGNLTK